MGAGRGVGMEDRESNKVVVLEATRMPSLSGFDLEVSMYNINEP